MAFNALHNIVAFSYGLALRFRCSFLARLAAPPLRRRPGGPGGHVAGVWAPAQLHGLALVAGASVPRGHSKLKAVEGYGGRPQRGILPRLVRPFASAEALAELLARIESSGGRSRPPAVQVLRRSAPRPLAAWPYAHTVDVSMPAPSSQSWTSAGELVVQTGAPCLH